ncbi:MAG: hypothetical protein J5760_05890, partial [Clostridia bacterium]|nr:hypothetical protein [Clostridia bacterium]
MKNTRILTVCCALLLVACAVLSVIAVKRDPAPANGAADAVNDAAVAGNEIAEKLESVYDNVYSRLANVAKLPSTEPLPTPAVSGDVQFKIDLLHFYAQSNNIVSILPFTTIQVTEAALLKAFMSSATAGTEALVYIDRYADRTLASAYETMDELLEHFSAMLTKYNISSSSAYTAKYNKLNSMFSSLKNASTELLSRTRTLIKMSKTEDYDTYYTNYVEQLSDLTGKIEQYCTVINNE